MKKIFEKLGFYSWADFWKFVKQFAKFGIVGVVNAAVQLGVYYLLLHFGINYYLANFFGFLCSVINAYIWNSLWVFRKEKTENKRNSLIKFFGTYLFTFLLSNVFLFLFVDTLGMSDKIAPLLIICINTPINFLLSKLWAFRSKKMKGEKS